MARGHEAQGENVGAFLLGALPDSERRAFERHLRRCAECRDEVDRLRPAAEALPQAVVPLEPPEGLKRSLMAAVAEEAGAARRRRPGARAAGDRAPVRALRVRPAIALAGVTLLVAALAAAYGLGRMKDDDSRVRTVAASVDRARAPAGSGTLMVGEAGAVLRVKGMPRDGGERVYVVWLERGGEPVAESSFNVGPDGSGKGAVESMAGVDRVLVTRERSAAARVPSEAPLVSVEL